MSRKWTAIFCLPHWWCWSLVVGLVLLCTGSPARGQSPGEGISGRTLAQKVYDRPAGKNSVAEVVMRLIPKNGSTQHRRLTIVTQNEGQRRNTLIRFTAPADIAGTGFLSLEDSEGRTRQFLYLPALQRTRRIVADQKGRSFVNTDFTYEDMERRPVAESKHTLVGEQDVNKQRCWVLDSKPRAGTHSEYSRVRRFVLQDSYVPIKIEFFVNGQKPRKTYTAQDVERIQGIWTETQVTMRDHADEHATEMETRQITYDTDIPDDMFTTQALERW